MDGQSIKNDRITKNNYQTLSHYGAIYYIMIDIVWINLEKYLFDYDKFNPEYYQALQLKIEYGKLNQKKDIQMVKIY